MDFMYRKGRQKLKGRRCNHAFCNLLLDIMCHPVARLLFIWICAATLIMKRKPRLGLIHRLPSEPFPLIYAGLAYLVAIERGECETGFLLLEKLVADSERPYRIRQLTAGAYYANDRLLPALDHCMKLMEEAPVKVCVDLSLTGRVLFKLGRYMDALEYFQESVDLKPEDAHAHCCLATTYEALEMREVAEREYSTAIELSTESELAAFARCRLSHLRNKCD